MLRWFLTGGPIPVLLLIGGVFFLFYLKGAPLSKPAGMLRALKGSGNGTGVSPFRAVMLALAGTLGVGNIVGVANALYIGGAGAVFWMWISALFAMLLKYAEILLAVLHRREDRGGGFFGGAFYYIRDCFLSLGKWRIGAVLSAVFSALMVVDALSMGCMIQVEAVASSLNGAFGVPLWACGLLLFALTLPPLFRGSRGISALTEYLVPVMSACYVLLAALVFVLCPRETGAAFVRIFKEALSPRSMAGGIIGFLTSDALRVGTMRGILSNEGGCGTAPTAHAAANAKSPAEQGIWGIFEVFVDTILLCTATAIVILVSFDEVKMLGEGGVMMTLRAFSSVLGRWSEGFLALSVFAFGYGTLLCWGAYGLESVRSLSKRGIWRYLYLFTFGICILWGAMAPPRLIWDVADFAIAAMTGINLLVLLLMRREIKEESTRCFQKYKK